MQQINWGIIGCGDVTEMKSGPAFNKISGSKLVAVMRRNAEKAQDYASRHGVPKWYGAADELINDPEVNAVYIATPPSSHAEYTIKVAEAGKPVYVEKPMARTYDECQKMIRACEDAGVPLFVAYYRRRLPRFLKIKELVDSGAIGEVRYVNVQLTQPVKKTDLDRENLPWRVLPEIASGGYFFDLASHQLDLLDCILGPVESANGIVANQAGLYPAEDIVCANFKFTSGVLANGVWCFTVSEISRLDRTEIVGSKGKIVYSTFEHESPIELHSEINPDRVKSKVEEFLPPTPEHIQQPLIQTIVEALQGQGECPSTGVTAARTSWVMDEMVKK